MGFVFYTAGALLTFIGFVWILQGVDLLPGSFMTGDIQWAMRGLVAAAVGIGLLALARKRSRRG